MEYLSDINLEGIQAFIMEMMKLLLKLDIRTIDTTTIPQLLTTFYPIWNPVWKLIGDFLTKYFGF